MIQESSEATDITTRPPMSIRCVGSKAVQQQGFAAAGILSVAWSWRTSSSIHDFWGAKETNNRIILYPKWPMEIDALPIKNGWIFPWQTVNVITRWYPNS